jgi:hypothetical protein
MSNSLPVESINFDYLPGEPESRRVWFIILRWAPPSYLLNKVIKFVDYKENLIQSPTFFKVFDIHGRNLVVEPYKSNTVKLTKNFDDFPQQKIPEFDDDYNSTYGNLNANIYSGNSLSGTNLYGNNHSNVFPRVGTQQYSQRPLTQENIYSMIYW